MDEIAGRAACALFRRSTSRWVRYRRLTVKFTMLGVRFLDVDFMRINFACASPTVYLIRFFCTVVKEERGCMERIAIAMQDGGTGAGAQHGGAGREANLILSCHRTSIWDPRGGTFWFQILWA